MTTPVVVCSGRWCYLLQLPARNLEPQRLERCGEQ